MDNRYVKGGVFKSGSHRIPVSEIRSVEVVGGSLFDKNIQWVAWAWILSIFMYFSKYSSEGWGWMLAITSLVVYVLGTRLKIATIQRDFTLDGGLIGNFRKMAAINSCQVQVR